MKVLKTLAVLSMVFTLAACKTAPEDKKPGGTTPDPAPGTSFETDFFAAFKGELNVTTPAGATIVLSEGGKKIALDADGTGTTSAAVTLTFVEATSASKATYTDSAETDPKTATVTLTADGGTLNYNEEGYTFKYKVEVNPAPFLDSIKGKLMDITTPAGATMELNADGKTITFDADGTGTASNPVTLTFVEAKSTTEATYTDGAAVNPKTATVTLTVAGGKLSYDAADYNFVYKVDEAPFITEVDGKTFTAAGGGTSTLIESEDGKKLTYDADGTASNPIALTFVRATSATEATYESADNKVATVTIAGTVLTLVYDGATVSYDIEDAPIVP